MQTDDQIIDDILEREGEAYTDRPADRGGPTKWGITLATFREFAPYLSPEELKRLNRSDAKTIYMTLYVHRPGFDRLLFAPLRALMIDAGVHHGPERAIRLAQGLFKGLLIDGILGPKTLAKLNNGTLQDVIYSGFVAARCVYYGQIIAGDPELIRARKAGFHLQAENAHGWARRLATFINNESTRALL